MLRDIDFEKVSDGRFYGPNDMVKADCHDCHGCSQCCRGMGSSIILDPLDVHQLSTYLSLTFEELLAEYLELNVVDGIILPNLRMTPGEDACPFLSAEGRCRIHAFRPGFCRIFPLGRVYENQSFRYFLQVHECPQPNKGKIKIRKWIGMPDARAYDQYITDWHYYLRGLQEQAMEAKDADTVKTLSMEVLRRFYARPFAADQSFYEQFYERFNL